MKKGLISAGAALSGCGALGLIAMAAVILLRLSQPADSIGIIGGADGPTAIFLTSRLGPALLFAVLPPVLLILAGAVLLVAALIMHKTKKKPGD